MSWYVFLKSGEIFNLASAITLCRLVQYCVFYLYIFEREHEKMCLTPYANNKGADQPAHPCSLISAFVVRFLDSIIPILTKSKIAGLVSNV